MKKLAISLSSVVLVLAGCATERQAGDQARDHGDYQAALTHYQAAAASGDSWSEMQLGDMYRSGRGVPKDLDQAMHWYQKSALDGNAISARMLGDAYLHNGAQPDYADAAKWYQVGVDDSDSYCALQLSVLYEHGLGVTKDKDEAAHWLDYYVGHTNIVGQKTYYKYSGGDNTGGFFAAVQTLLYAEAKYSPDLRKFSPSMVTLTFRMQDGRALDVVAQPGGDPQAEAAAVTFMQKAYLPPVLASLSDRTFSMDLVFGSQ